MHDVFKCEPDVVVYHVEQVVARAAWCLAHLGCNDDILPSTYQMQMGAKMVVLVAIMKINQSLSKRTQHAADVVRTSAC